MLPCRWNSAPDLPYSIHTPLLERSIRRSSSINLNHRWSTISAVAIALIFPIVMLLTEDILKDTMRYILLILAWSLLLVTMVSATVMAATSTFVQRHSQHYQLLWLTPLSDRELGYSLSFDTLYRLRWMLAVSVILAPTLVVGMVEVDAWAVKSCEWLDFADTCDPIYPQTVNVYSSIIYGILMWLVCCNLIFIATMMSIAFTLKWNNPLVASTLTIIATFFGLGLIISLSITTVTPHISATYGWGSPLTVVLLLILFWHSWLLMGQKRIFQSNAKMLVILGWCTCMVIASTGFVFWPSEYRTNLFYLELTAIAPEIILVIIALYFWRDARTHIE